MNIYKLELHLPYAVSCLPVSMEINTAGTGGLAYTRRIRNFTYNGKGNSSNNNNMQLCAAACHAVVKCKGKRLRRFRTIRVANNSNNTTMNNKQINIPRPKRSQMTMTRFWFTLQWQPQQLRRQRRRRCYRLRWRCHIDKHRRGIMHCTTWQYSRLCYAHCGCDCGNCATMTTTNRATMITKLICLLNACTLSSSLPDSLSGQCIP